MGPRDYLTRHEKSGNLGRRRSKDKSLSCAHVRNIQRQHRHKQWSVLGRVSKEDKAGGDIREGHCYVTRLFLTKHNTHSLLTPAMGPTTGKSMDTTKGEGDE